ncbi:unnamed protein product [Mycolicibacterium novocastrense]|uniref:Uncharacterized protein n=1 Tax=Mycolicibacterium novocastrense TaxID=59813 RepID=A0ABQ0KRT1_MYCNV|nr:unnamed protein product [Mycolicibacterium novocastrense]
MTVMSGLGILSDVSQMLSVPSVGIFGAGRWALRLGGVLVSGGSRMWADVSLLWVGHHSS